MTIFVHDDQMYAPDEWHPRYTHVLSERYRLRTRLVNLHLVPASAFAAEVTSRDGLLARWGHVPTDLACVERIADQVTTLFGGRIFPAPQSYLYYDNKARQASLFLNRGYPTPATAVVSSIEELEAFVAREALSLPIVVKASHGAGSSAVRLLDRVSDSLCRAAVLSRQ
jgi:biotin carboxylase